MLRSLALSLVAPLLLAAQTPSTRPTPPVACSSSDAAVEFGSPVTLSAHARAVPRQKLTYVWTADSGTVTQGTNGQAQWTGLDLGKIEEGIQTATVVVRDGARVVGRCGVEVLVVASLDKAIGGRGETAYVRALLYEGQQETAGVGLYSYLLFTSDTPRNQAVLEAVMKKVRGLLADFVRSGDIQNKNANYIPVKGSPGPSDAINDVKFVYARYDASRALGWLQKLQLKPNGTYLVSTKTPIEERGKKEPLLVFDLSTVPPNLAPLMVGEFLMQASKANFSQTSALNNFLLSTRLAMETFTTGIINVSAAITIVK
jgi:hypothetical protein